MKDKKLFSRLLALAVAGIWIAVGYKYVSRFFFEGETVSPQNYAASAKEVSLPHKDTFKMETLRRNPFTGNMETPRISTRSATVSYRKTSAERKPIVRAPEMKFPEIEYFGFVKSNNGSSELAMLKINGKMSRLYLNGKSDGITVRKIAKDSVVVQCGKQKKVIGRAGVVQKKPAIAKK
ncbi:hypothetical protein HUK80_00065 [Flavobacterium sp. MAH-1]|uniref:Uncharacterized protein n=1 Tax=Flavobacterium agri TaxID=2743471 RepID=A0A7Y8XYG5_9FLAO|nr:hypothetical protein [Flavobacterium agri]NUY79270.1 hypothetical protein [Flavobacterium agri]NYA69294.1 hypothetical protein [Flavobacterium agri]